MHLTASVQRLLYDRCRSLLPVVYELQSQRIPRSGGNRHIVEQSNGVLRYLSAGSASAISSNQLHIQQCSSSSSREVDWMSWLGFAAAAAVASTASSTSAYADAAAAGDDGDKVVQSALSSAELAVSEAFQEIMHDWDRAAAMHKEQHGSSNSSSHARPQPPAVKLDGHLLTVVIPLLPGADVPHLLRLIDHSLDQLALQGSSSSSQQQQTRLLGTSKVVQWDISRSLKVPPSVKHKQLSSSSSKQQLKVQVVLPLQPGGSPHDKSTNSSSSSSSDTSPAPGTSCESSSPHGHVAVVKPRGGFTVDELALLARLVTAANKPGGYNANSSSDGYLAEDTWLGPFGLPGSSSSSGSLSGGFPPGGHLGDVFGGLADQVLGRMLGGLVDELFQELRGGGDDGHGGIRDQQEWQQHLQQQLQNIEQQLQESVPPEIVTWLQDFKRRQQQQHGTEAWPSDAVASHDASDVSNRSAQDAPASQQQQQQLPWQTPAARSAAQQLQQLGAQVYFPTAAAITQQQQQQQQGADDPDHQQSDDSWGVLAGYDDQKQALEDFLLLPLKHPEVFDRVAARTRKSVKASGGSRPRAVLFEGPPGTGKTSSARLLSRRAALPLVYVPLEALVSKWYGESEQNLAKLFKQCEALGGCIIFLDELDSLATSRDRSDMHEASRRLLGVLLREIDGFDNTLGAAEDSSSSSSTGSDSSGSKRSSRRSVLIGATNRRQDLDAALLSRFDLSIHFGLPDESCRAAILQQYANHLSSEQLARIAEHTRGFSGRDLRDVCEQTERQWASKIIRGEVDAEQLPNVEDYLTNVRQRREGAGSRGAGGGTGGGYPWAAGQYRT